MAKKRKRRNAGKGYYEVGHSAVPQHFRTLASAKKVAQRWADNTGLMIRVHKVDATGHVDIDAAKAYPRASSKNPKQMLFKTKAAAVKYARNHGAKKFSVRKLKRGR